MKLYYFMIIAIGLMFTLNLAGVDTGSSQILTYLQTGENQTAVLNPTVSATTSSAISGATTFWIALTAFFILVGAITALRINVGVAAFQATTESILAVFAGLIFGVFALDFYSILTKMRDVTNGTGWEYYLTWILIVPFLVGFAISLVQFVKGTE